jgi:Winged helix-turn helix
MVYRALHRQGWRKVTPRPKHPKASEEAREVLAVLGSGGRAPRQAFAGAIPYETDSTARLESTTESGRTPVGRSTGKWFANRVFDSLAAREEQLVMALTLLENDPQRVASLTGFDWIRSISLNAH